MKYDARLVRRAAVTLMLTLPLALAAPALADFVDMVGHWSAEAVGALFTRGIVSGVDLNHFQPDTPVTRAQFARLLAEALGQRDAANALRGHATHFTDVPGDHWAAGYVEALAELGALTGYPDGGFHPEAPVTRAEMASVLARVAGGRDAIQGLADAPLGYVDRQDIPGWDHGAVAFVSQQHYMLGFDDGTFRPNSLTTRAQAAAMLLQFLALRGQLYNASGTLVRWDSAQQTGVLRLPTGEQRQVALAPGALIYRQGERVPPWQIQVLDQVWVIEQQGKGAYLSAHYQDRFCEHPQSQAPGVWACDTGGKLLIRPETLLFVNGRPAREMDLTGTRVAYVALDAQTGVARAVDALLPSLSGKVDKVTDSFVSVQLATGMSVNVGYGPQSQFFRHGQQIAPLDLRPGEAIDLAQQQGTVTMAYVTPE